MAGLAHREDCVRCFTPTRATIVGSFAYEDHDYEVPLCDPHARLFDQEMLSWSRLAREKKRPSSVTSTSFSGPAVLRPNVQIKFPVTNGGEIVHESQVAPYERVELDPDVISAWSFSERASAWIAARGLTHSDVLWVIVAQDKLDEPTDEADPQTNSECRAYTHGDLRVLVNPDRLRVINVGRRTERT